jgi:hypothetical protein
MKKQMTMTILALSFVLSAAHFTFAQDQTIDNFSTGNLQPVLVKVGSQERIQTGNMLGGSRDTVMSVCDTTKKGECARVNPYNQASSFGFLPARGGQPPAMVQTAGYFAPPRIDMYYGLQSTMHADFSGYQKIRVKFSGLTQELNFNIQPHTGGPYAQGGCNIAPYGGSFSVELPLDKFIVTDGFSFADVTWIDVIFQDGSVLGGVSFGITSIELTNTTAGGVVIDCHY